MSERCREHRGCEVYSVFGVQWPRMVWMCKDKV